MVPLEVRSRMSAEERRAKIVEIALSEFAIGGLHGTSTEAVAQRAGNSQPYLFRVVGKKKGRFLPVIGGRFHRPQGAFRAGPAGSRSGRRPARWGTASIHPLPDR